MAKNQKFNSSQLNEFENSPQFSELLSDPEFIKGYSQGEALAQTIKQTPMQPEVTAEAIQPEPQFVQPSSTRYVPISGETPETSVYDQMLAASGDKEQKNLLYKLMAKSMQQQEAGVKQAEEALRKEQERQAGLSTFQKLDLRPFAEAIRSYGSTTVAPGYAPEMTELQRQEVLRKLQGQLQAAQQGLTKEQVAALRQMKEDKSSAQADISRRAAELRETKAVVDPLNKITFKASEFKQTANQIDSVLDKEEIPVAELRQVITKFGRMMGEVGAQTQQDREAYYTPTMAAQFESFFNRLGNVGKVSAKDPSVLAIVNQMQYAKDAAAKDLRYKTRSIEETYGSPDSVVSYQFNKGKPGHAAVQKAYELADSMMMAKEPKKKQSESMTPSEATAAQSMMSKEQKSRLEELRKKYGK